MSSVITMGRRPFDFANDYEPVSLGSQAISKRWVEERDYLRGAATDWHPALEAAFGQIRQECNNANWDGMGAAAINEAVVAAARRLARALFDLLPKGMLPPDVMAEADGEISLSWSIDASRVFALSIGEHDIVNFAGQFGEEGAIHGWQPIDTSSGRAVETSLQDIAWQIARLNTPAIRARAA